MDKSTLTIGTALLVIFAMTVVAHMVYVKGISFGKEGHSAAPDHTITIYSTEQECEKATHAECVLQLCDNIPAGEEYEDICGQGFKKGWRLKPH